MSQYRSCAFTTGFAENHNTVSFMFSKGTQWFEKGAASKEAEKYLNACIEIICFLCVFSNVTIKK